MTTNCILFALGTSSAVALILVIAIRIILRKVERDMEGY